MQPKTITPDQLLTSHQASELLQVNPSSINKWVSEGRLPAFRTPGGHRRIRAADLAGFLSAHNMPIPKALASVTKQKILLVDDDPKQLESFARVLKPFNDYLEVLLADNGIDALLLIGAEHPQVVILDAYMPGVDGLEVCRRLKVKEETRTMDIIVLSGEMSPDLEKRAREAGATLTLQRPLEVRRIVEHLGLPEERLAATA
jgi:excisionase family DNA binding protein